MPPPGANRLTDMMTDGERGAVQTYGKPPYRLAHKNARRWAKLTKRSSNRQAFGAASV
jgi:hypothetical protein